MRIRDPFEEVERWMGPFGNQMRERVDVAVERNVLTVTAERPEEQPENATWLLRERPTGTHRREVRLGDRFDPSKVEASYDNGVLTVTIPVHEEALPHKVSIATDTKKSIEADSTENAV